MVDGGFGALLRAYRGAAGLTQESLAEIAGLSVEAIGALERGARQFPRADTVHSLADALRLPAPARVTFLDAAVRPKRKSAGTPRSLVERALGGRVPRQLPIELNAFTGRAREVQELTRILEMTDEADRRSATVAAITGMGGTGKTALAIHVAHRLVDTFADGQIYLNLGGHAAGTPMSSGEALGRILSALDVPADEIPTDLSDASALYRSVLGERKVLVVLDNASDASQVGLLLPGASASAAIVTSRRALFTLPATYQLALGLLSESDGLALLAAIVGARRVETEQDVAHDIVRYCGHLPLAIQIAGARAVSRTNWPLSHLRDRLAVEHRRLDELWRYDLGVRANFAASIDELLESSDALDQHAGHAFTVLGLAPGRDIDLAVAVALLDESEHEVDRILERLVDAHLLEAATPGRYALHDLLGLYARERADVELAPDYRVSAFSRLLQLYLAAAWRVTVIYYPNSPRTEQLPTSIPVGCAIFDDPEALLDWLDQERTNVVATVITAAEIPGIDPVLVTSLASGLGAYFSSRHSWTDWIRVNEAAIRVGARHLTETALGVLYHDLGFAYCESGWYDRGTDHFERSLASFVAAGDRHGEALTLCNLSYVCGKTGRVAEGISYGVRALELAVSLADPLRIASASLALGLLHDREGDRARALRYHQKSRLLFQRNGTTAQVATAWLNVGATARSLGRYSDAVKALTTCIDLRRQASDSLGEAEAWDELARAHFDANRPVDARRCASEGLRLAAEHGDRYREERIRGLLAVLDSPTKA
jgi:transcriptional regulator with XRE-family HTH domain/tetratricopeptide (TPR) repeat protein